jgi:hypothetical protein
MLPSALRPGLALGLLGVALVGTAQDTVTLTLTRDGADRGNSLEVRPNTKQPFFGVVKNTAGQTSTYFAEIEG